MNILEKRLQRYHTSTQTKPTCVGFIILIFYTLSFYFLTACSQNQQPQKTTISQCPTQPSAVLETNNVKAVSLSSQSLTESGMVTNNKSLGYTFTAKSGNKLVYQTNEDICIWVYTPDNQLINSPILSLDGKYTVQVAAKQGSTTFDLALQLEDNTQTLNLSSASIPTPVETTQVNIPTPVKTTNSTSNSNNISRISPAKAIEDYYIKINNQQYQSAWDIYPEAVKENKELHPDGYNSFIEWWEKVDYVNIDNVSIEEDNYNYAIVNIISRYKIKNGKLIPVRLKFYLEWEQQSQSWYVNKIQHNK